MSGIYLYDDARARQFEPFALTRPTSELVAGVALIRDRWVTALNLPATGALSSPHLSYFGEMGAPHAASRVPRNAVVANARFAPKLRVPVSSESAHDVVARAADETPEPEVWTSGGRVVAVRLDSDLEADDLRGGAVALDDLAKRNGRAVELEGWWMDEVWDFIRLLPEMITDDIAYLHQSPMGTVYSSSGPAPAHATVFGAHEILVARDIVVGGQVLQSGAVVEPQVVLDASAGPIYIGPGATVHAFTRIVGPCYIGRNSTVLGDRVAGCSIGDTCKVRGELSNTIMLGHANKGHDGFVGHSYLGRWVNLGAGTITSNLKNTYGTVALWTPSGVRDTGMQFFGTLFGDHAKTGIGTRLTTGTVMGACANVYGGTVTPRMIPPFAWGSAVPFAQYRLEKFLVVAERVMARRHVMLDERGRLYLTAVHAACLVESGTTV